MNLIFAYAQGKSSNPVFAFSLYKRKKSLKYSGLHFIFQEVLSSKFYALIMTENILKVQYEAIEGKFLMANFIVHMRF